MYIKYSCQLFFSFLFVFLDSVIVYNEFCFMPCLTNNLSLCMCALCTLKRTSKINKTKLCSYKEHCKHSLTFIRIHLFIRRKIFLYFFSFFHYFSFQHEINIYIWDYNFFLVKRNVCVYKVCRGIKMLAFWTAGTFWNM